LALRAVVNAITHGDVSGAVRAAAFAAVVYGFTTYVDQVDMVLVFLLVEQVGLLVLQPGIDLGIAGLEGLDHLERVDFLDRVTLVRGSAWGLVFSMWVAVDSLFNLSRLGILMLTLGVVSPWLFLLLLFAAAPLWFERRRLQAAGWKLAGWLIFTAGFVGGLWLVANRATDGPGTIGDVVLAVTVVVNLRQAVHVSVGRTTAAADGGRLIEPYLWLREYIAEQGRMAKGTRPAPAELRDGIRLRNLSYTYPGTEGPALDDVDPLLLAGSVVAVVGQYGSGKTTLVKLLLKFYRPDRGAIVLDDLDLSEVDAADWRRHVSGAFQDFGRFRTRFGETVGLGDLEHIDDRARIGEALGSAEAGELVSRLPDGLDTQLGRDLGGVDLSEGQWQKTALARASMRPRRREGQSRRADGGRRAVRLALPHPRHRVRDALRVRPTAAARDRVDQCVASFGVVFRLPADAGPALQAVLHRHHGSTIPICTH
jgi:ATP-binding cassette subfamily B protein